jgi:hypothetical protein
MTNNESQAYAVVALNNLIAEGIIKVKDEKEKYDLLNKIMKCIL